MSMFLSLPGFEDERGRPWYALNVSTGEVVSYRKRGPTAGLRTHVPKVLKPQTSGYSQFYCLYRPDGTKYNMTRKKLVYSCMMRYWGLQEDIKI